MNCKNLTEEDTEIYKANPTMSVKPILPDLLM